MISTNGGGGALEPREANIRAKPVLMEFDRTLALAEALIAERPLRASLTQCKSARGTGWNAASTGYITLSTIASAYRWGVPTLPGSLGLAPVVGGPPTISATSLLSGSISRMRSDNLMNR